MNLCPIYKIGVNCSARLYGKMIRHNVKEAKESHPILGHEVSEFKTEFRPLREYVILNPEIRLTRAAGVLLNWDGTSYTDASTSVAIGGWINFKGNSKAWRLTLRELNQVIPKKIIKSLTTEKPSQYGIKEFEFSGSSEIS